MDKTVVNYLAPTGVRSAPSGSTDINYSYTGNRRDGFSYDAAGNLTNDIGQQFTYDVTGQQTASSYTNLQNGYDGDGLRVKRTEDGLPATLYLRSSVLGGQVVAEIIWASVSWQWNRGYVYLGSQLLAVQQAGVYWMHEDPVTKSKRVTNSAGAIVSTIELDPWGADTNRSSNGAFQPKKFTSYERDATGSDEAMFRRYNRWQSRFDQPDPYDGSYDMTNPQSFNRYAYERRALPILGSHPKGPGHPPAAPRKGSLAEILGEGEEKRGSLVFFLMTMTLHEIWAFLSPFQKLTPCGRWFCGGSFKLTSKRIKILTRLVGGGKRKETGQDKKKPTTEPAPEPLENLPTPSPRRGPGRGRLVLGQSALHIQDRIRLPAYETT